MKIKDFPKLNSPFQREIINGHYSVTPKINPKYKWVFEDKGVMAVDKIDGSGFSLLIKNGKIDRVFNRTNEKFPFLIKKQTKLEGAILEGIAGAIKKGWFKGYGDGQIFGELIGETINTNRHQIKGHLFVPFDYLYKSCFWKSWVQNKYPKTFDAISDWFREGGLISLFNQKMGLPEIQAEGLVFYHPDGRKAKLRKNMYGWFYE